MSQKKKLLKKFLERPASVSFPEIQILLLSFGFRQETIRGSHFKYSHSDIRGFIILPVHHGDCKIRYKIRIKNLFITNNLTSL